MKSNNNRKDKARTEKTSTERRFLKETNRYNLSKVLNLNLLEESNDTTTGEHNTVVGVGVDGEMPDRKIIYEHTQEITDGEVAEQKFLDGTKLMGEDMAPGRNAISLRGEGGGGGERESGSSFWMKT